MGKNSSPGTPTTYAPPAPPTAANAAAIQASVDQRQKMLQKQGLTSTLLKGQKQLPTGQSGTLLGSAGSAFAPAAGGQKNSLLGGG